MPASRPPLRPLAAPRARHLARSAASLLALALVAAIASAPSRAEKQTSAAPPGAAAATIEKSAPTPGVAARSETGAPEPVELARPARPLSPMMREIAATLENERKALEILEQRFGAAPDADAALAIQREIEQLKTGTEISLLRIQAGYARREGRIETAQRIEASIEEMLHPPVVRATVERPVPASDVRR